MIESHQEALEGEAYRKSFSIGNNTKNVTPCGTDLYLDVDDILVIINHPHELQEGYWAVEAQVNLPAQENGRMAEPLVWAAVPIFKNRFNSSDGTFFEEPEHPDNGTPHEIVRQRRGSTLVQESTYFSNANVITPGTISGYQKDLIDFIQRDIVSRLYEIDRRLENKTPTRGHVYFKEIDSNLTSFIRVEDIDYSQKDGTGGYIIYSEAPKFTCRNYQYSDRGVWQWADDDCRSTPPFDKYTRNKLQVLKLNEWEAFGYLPALGIDHNSYR